MLFLILYILEMRIENRERWNLKSVYANKKTEL